MRLNERRTPKNIESKYTQKKKNHKYLKPACELSTYKVNNHKKETTPYSDQLYLYRSNVWINQYCKCPYPYKGKGTFEAQRKPCCNSTQNTRSSSHTSLNKEIIPARFWHSCGEFSFGKHCRYNQNASQQIRKNGSRSTLCICKAR